MKETFKKNWVLLTIVIGLCLFGMLVIYSASSYSAGINYKDSFFFVKKQAFGFAIGIILLFIMAKFDYHKFTKLKWWIIAISIIMLILVFVPGLGKSNNGANRWIGLGGFSIQSSEVAKFGFVIFTACYMAQNYKKMKTFKGILPVLGVGGIICLLILLEPNLSVTLCVGMVLMFMLLIGGIKLKHFMMLAIPALCLVPVLIIIEPYRLQRLMAFINPWANPQGEGFQLIQSLYALGSGGLFGVGIFNSRQKYLFLPFSESDFIFSIIGEEFGFIGCLILCTAYLILIIQGIKIAFRASDRIGSYLAFGITSVIATQMLINIAVVTGSIPPTGIPLPFISAGGTSLMVFLAAIGILLNVSHQSSKYVNNYEKMKLKDVFKFNFKNPHHAKTK